MSSVLRIVFACWVSVAISGCFFIRKPWVDPNPQTSGELGAGSFRYKCIDSAEPVCLGSNAYKDFPSVIALGASFELQYLVSNVDLVSTTDTRLLEVSENVFKAESEGTASLYAQSLSNSRVSDILHFDVTSASQLRLALSSEADEPTTFKVGQTTPLYLTLLDANGIALAGSVKPEWTIDDPTIASFSVPDSGMRAGVNGVKAGVTRVWASYKGIQQWFAITVLEAQ